MWYKSFIDVRTHTCNIYPVFHYKIRDGFIIAIKSNCLCGTMPTTCYQRKVFLLVIKKCVTVPLHM